MTTDDGLGRRLPKTDEPQMPSPKEQKEILTRMETGETFPVVERKGEVGKEVKDWIKEVKTAGEIELPSPVKDDQTGQVLVKPTAPQQPKIILPLDQPTFSTGFKKSVSDSIRWLVELIKRMILMFPERTVFRS